MLTKMNVWDLITLHDFQLLTYLSKFILPFLMLSNATWEHIELLLYSMINL